MNTQKIYSGIVVANYEELCKLLSENKKTGKSKILQMLDFERFFSWEKCGHKFVIKEVYDMPKDKTDNRSKGNHNVYCKYIESILIDYLSECKDNTNVLTNKQWYKLLGIVNDEYVKHFKDSSFEFDYITEADVMSFYHRSGSIIRSILLNALNSMSKRKLIKYSEQTVIVYKCMGKQCSFVAGDCEEEEILNAEYDVLHNTMKMDNIYQVYVSGRQREYYQLVEKYLYEMYGYEYYYKQLKITSISKENLQNEKCKLDRDIYKGILNKTAADYLDKNAKSIQSKSNGEPWEMPQKYVDVQVFLSNELIRTPENKIDICIIKPADIVYAGEEQLPF